MKVELIPALLEQAPGDADVCIRRQDPKRGMQTARALLQEWHGRLSFVVVGGGYSGVETAGQIADLLGLVTLYDLMREPAQVETVTAG